MRLGLYLDIAPHGGGQFQYALSMLEALEAYAQARGAELIVVATHEAWLARLQGRNLTAHYWPINPTERLAQHAWRKIGLPVSIWRLGAPLLAPHVRRLKALNCGLWVYPAQDAMAYMLPEPAMTTVHDLMHIYEPQFPEVSGRRIRDYHYRATARHALSILVDSEVGAAQLATNFAPRGQVGIVPYVAPAYVTTSQPLSEPIRARIPASFLLYPAQFWQHKNHLALLRGLVLAAPEAPDARLVFCGARKNGYEQVMATATELGVADRITVLDYVSDEDLVGLYRKARALIMPTYFGPTNIPPLEAMALDCPAAVSDIYGMREQCGDAALYFDQKSDQDIARAIATLWNDEALRHKLIEAGRLHHAVNTQARFNQDVQRTLDAAVASSRQ